MAARDPDDWENSYGPDLSADEIAGLGLSTATVERIDACLMDAAEARWLKAARVVVEAMMHLRKEDVRFSGVPDLFYAVRLRALVANGQLEAQGDLYRMRFSEVRLPAGS